MSEQVDTKMPEIVFDSCAACFESDVCLKYGLDYANTDIPQINRLERSNDVFLYTQIGEATEVAHALKVPVENDEFETRTQYLGLIDGDNYKKLNQLFEVNTSNGLVQEHNSTRYYFNSDEGSVIGAMVKDGKILQFGDGILTAMGLLTNNREKSSDVVNIELEDWGITIETEKFLYVIHREEHIIHKVPKLDHQIFI